MELMKGQWRQGMGLSAMLHGKRFGVNGSGKHNKWSISTDSGKNLLDPGKSPADNLQFLLFLACGDQGRDEYQDLLRHLRGQCRKRSSSGRQ